MMMEPNEITAKSTRKNSTDGSPGRCYHYLSPDKDVKRNVGYYQE